MRNIRHRVFTALLIGGTAALMSEQLAFGEDGGQRLDRAPSHAVGDSYTYNWDHELVTFTYLGRQGDRECYSVRTPTQGREATQCRSLDDNPMQLVGNWQPHNIVPHQGSYSFPLYIGKSWDVSYPGVPMATGTGDTLHHISTNYRLQAEVIGYESVTVPAGTFAAFKIKGTDQAWGDYKPNIVTYYYSPQLGLVKYDGSKMASAHIELVSYKSAR